MFTKTLIHTAIIAVATVAGFSLYHSNLRSLTPCGAVKAVTMDRLIQLASEIDPQKSNLDYISFIQGASWGFDQTIISATPIDCAIALANGSIKTQLASLTMASLIALRP